MEKDRRQHRSSRLGTALALQLATCRRNAALDAIVLGDQDGLLIAGSGPDDVCATLAAHGGAPTATTHRSFVVDGTRVQVIALGGVSGEARQREVDRAVVAAHRMLAA